MAELVTTGEAAKIIKTDVQSVRRWADRGLLRVVRHPTSNARLIRAEDCEALREKLEGIAV